MERVQPDGSKLSALDARRTPDVSLALSSSRLGGVTRDASREPTLQPTTSSAHPGLAPTPRWNTLNTTTHRGPRSSKIPGRNLYGSLSSAIGLSKDSSHVNYTVSEDATGSNLLNKFSRMLAILDESVLVHLVVVTNTQAYEGEPNYRTAHDVTPTKKDLMPDIPYISHGSPNSPGLGYPMGFGRIAEALRSAFVAKQQIAEINAKFCSWANSKGGALTKRQMWYSLASWHPILDEPKIRSVTDRWLRYTKTESINAAVYLSIVSSALYGHSALKEDKRMFRVLAGSTNSTVEVADLLKSISSCDDHAKLRTIIQSIDIERAGFINIGDWIDYLHSFQDFQRLNFLERLEVKLMRLEVYIEGNSNV